MTIEFIVLAHDSSSNALGRAQSLALAAQVLGRTEVWAVDRGGWWKGARQFATENVLVANRGGALAANLERFRTPGSRLVIWVTKGLDPLPSWHRHLELLAPDALTILDVDDDDAGLADEFRRRSIVDRAKLNVLRAGHPQRVRRAQARLWERADGLTYASEAVRATFPPFRRESRWIPHVRADARRQDHPRTGSSVRVGVFGTIRPHKGQQLVLDLIRQHRDVEVHAFADSGLGVPAPDDLNWVELAPDTPLTEAYAGVDAALLPMSVYSKASDVQFPAKLVDAMQAGVAIVATPTTAIREIAQDAFTSLVARPTALETRDAIVHAIQSGTGKRARELYTDRLTPEAAATQLKDAVSAIISAKAS